MIYLGEEIHHSAVKVCGLLIALHGVHVFPHFHCTYTYLQPKIGLGKRRRRRRRRMDRMETATRQQGGGRGVRIIKVETG